MLAELLIAKKLYGSQCLFKVLSTVVLDFSFLINYNQFLLQTKV